MDNFPGRENILVSQGGVECVIGDPGARLPVTIEGIRLGTEAVPVTITGPALYGRRTASPNKLVPFQNGGAITDPGNTTNAVVDVPNADAVKFRVGDLATFVDVSTGLVSSEALTIDIISAADGGTGGAGFAKITFTAETWSTAPEAADILVVSDGGQLSANAVIVLEDIVFDGVKDIPSAAFINGQFRKSVIGGTTYFIQADNQVVQLVAID